VTMAPCSAWDAGLDRSDERLAVADHMVRRHQQEKFIAALGAAIPRQPPRQRTCSGRPARALLPLLRVDELADA
jgi:hypothetical protein